MNEILDQGINSSKQYQRPVDLEGATGIVTRGVFSIILMGIIGLILAIVNITKANGLIENYKKYPGKYTESSYKKVVGGRMCSYVSLGIMGLLLIVIIVGSM